MKKATLYKKLKDKKLKCLACSHYCQIGEGKTGICGIRQNVGGDLYLTLYGKHSGIQIDPIEKKPFFHFLPGESVFSIGTIGCNFRCGFCQNAWMSQPTRDNKIPVPELYDLAPEEIVKECLKRKIKIIAYTYNEPSIAFEYCYDTAKLAHEKGIKNVFVSNGYASKEAIEKIAPYLDAINVDLKAFSKDFYQKTCGGKLSVVLNNIKNYFEKGIWLEITTLVIPGQNDSNEELTKIARFIASVSPDIPWHISRFHPDYEMMDGKVTSENTLERSYDIGREAGLKYIYVGNTSNQKMESTYCPKCGALLIEREIMLVRKNNLVNGLCPKCRQKIPGAWK